MSIKIAKQHEQSEAEITASILFKLRDALGDDFIVRAEYGYNHVRFDIAIFRADTRDLICTLEVKKKLRRTNKAPWANSHERQRNRYWRLTGRPCILVSEHTIDVFIAKFERIASRWPQPRRRRS